MKRKIFFAALILVAVVASFQWGIKRENLDSLRLENVEALANGESEISLDCFGFGSVDCPHSDVKVYFVGGMLSLN